MAYCVGEWEMYSITERRHCLTMLLYVSVLGRGYLHDELTRFTVGTVQLSNFATTSEDGDAQCLHRRADERNRAEVHWT